jgi:dihydroorotase
VSVQGWPMGTFVRGRKVMWEGELTGPSQGETIVFQEAIGMSRQ